MLLLSDDVILPIPPDPVGSYERGVIRNGIGFVSGQFPLVNGALLYQGRVGNELTEEQGVKAAQVSAFNIIAQIDCLLEKDWSRFGGLLRIEGYIASDDKFSQQISVLNSASETFLQILGEKGKHARAAFIVSRLPLNAPLELVASFSVET